jgi:hypothetical protein
VVYPGSGKPLFYRLDDVIDVWLPQRRQDERLETLNTW